MKCAVQNQLSNFWILNFSQTPKAKKLRFFYEKPLQLNVNSKNPKTAIFYKSANQKKKIKSKEQPKKERNVSKLYLHVLFETVSVKVKYGVRRNLLRSSSSREMAWHLCRPYMDHMQCCGEKKPLLHPWKVFPVFYQRDGVVHDGCSSVHLWM